MSATKTRGSGSQASDSPSGDARRATLAAAGGVAEARWAASVHSSRVETSPSGIPSARAFSTRPRVLFADEPTGNLDARTGGTIIDLMTELNRDLGTTLVLVTHDHDLAARARRTIRLADGKIVADTAA